MSAKSSLSEQLDRLEGWRAAWAWAVMASLGLRLGLGAVMAGTWLIIKPRLAPGLLNNPNVYGVLDIPTTSPGDAFLGVWVRWDAVHHLNLAALGYENVSTGDSVFYPLFALLTRAFAGPLGGDLILASLIVATLATCAALAGLYRLTDSAFGPCSARWSVLVLASFPTAVFLVAPFTESLFLALTIGAFLTCRRGRWWLAGALGLLASLARGPGMLTSLALAIVAWREWRTTRPRLLSFQTISMLAGVALPVVGGLGFLAWRHAAGLPPVTAILRQYSELVLTNPVSGLVASVQQWLRAADFTMTLEVLTAPLFIALTAAMFLNPRWRKPEWTAYVVVNLGLFLSKQSLTGSSLQSLPRYVLMLFPVFIVVGDWLAHRGRRTQFIYLAVSSAALLVFGALYTLWVFIG